MYLLIPEDDTIITNSIQFTSHYVSINSCMNPNKYMRHFYLHPTMYLLILMQITHECDGGLNLHPTMYLLILICFNAST